MFIASERETWDDTSAPQREAHQGNTSSKESQHDTNKHDAVRRSALSIDLFLHFYVLFVFHLGLHRIESA